jgi:hypothetical protein
MPNQSQGHNQRDQTTSIALDQFRKLRPIVVIQPFAEISGKMLQHIRMISPRGRAPHDFTKRHEVLCLRGDKISEYSHSSLAVRHEEELVTGVKPHHCSASRTSGPEIQPAFVGKHRGHEVLAEPGIVQPAFLLRR